MPQAPKCVRLKFEPDVVAADTGECCGCGLARWNFLGEGWVKIGRVW